MSVNKQVIQNTADIRAKLLDVWRRIDDKTISSSEARQHIAVARAILDTLKVEMAAAHLAQQEIPSVPVIGGGRIALRDRQ